MYARARVCLCVCVQRLLLINAMRFEEVSPPVEIHFFSAISTTITRLSEEVHTLSAALNITRNEINTTIYSTEFKNITLAAARAIAPGGLTSVLLAIAIFLRILQSSLVRSHATALIKTVLTLAADSTNTNSNSNENNNSHPSHSKIE